MSGVPTGNFPPPLNYAAPQQGRTDLRTIAVRQRAIMLCILAYIIFAVVGMAAPPPLKLLLALAAFAVSITGAVFVFMLAMALYSTGVGILLGILTLVPLVGLIVLLVINGKATKVLREYGIQVGLLGAKANQIPDPGTTPIR